MMTESERTRYALAQQLPDMNHGFLIHTGHGDIDILAEESAPVVELIEKILEQRLSVSAEQGRVLVQG